MKRVLILCLLALIANISFSQTLYESIKSNKLGENRQIKIQLPRNYDKNLTLGYPVIIVLDGDYLFEPVAGNIDYYSYWEDMPDAIVVGILHGEKRQDDLLYDEEGFPAETGAKFFEFIGQELFPYIDSSFRTENFRAIVGHAESANYLNFYLFKDVPLFNSYISLSPNFSPNMEARLAERLSTMQEENKIFYYMATADSDIKSHRVSIEGFDKKLSAIDKDNVSYSYNKFVDGSHYSVVTSGIPKAIDNIFKAYRPITRKEYKEDILTSENPYEYLVNKYETIKTLFGIDKQILGNDFKAIETALRKKEDWESFTLLAKLAKENYPKSVLPMYYMGIFYENTGEPKKAVKSYKSGYGQIEVAGVTIDHMLSLAEEIEIDFGWK
ncbi:MAG: esterase [Flavobacteriaceae bacterium]|nr:esterase [Flavobacteriaceae bacterium]